MFNSIIFISRDIIMSKSVPTHKELDDAQDYALSKLCTEIADRFGAPGITEWDGQRKVCMITKRGCQASVTNPLSRQAFNAGGEYIKLDEHHPVFGEFWKKHPAGYYSWKVTKNSGGKSVCSPSNYLMERWCKSPETRLDGKFKRGVTDTVPLNWTVRNGKEVCEITKEYCRSSKGVSYDTQTRNCFVSDAQQVAEFFTGSVFIREQNIKNYTSDKRLKKNIVLVRKNYPVKGVNVYAFEWNDTARRLYGHTGGDTGFLADELDPKYIVTDSHGFKNINLSYDDDTMQKMYTFLKIKNLLIQ
tara:strand:- start:401 stop:1306 length:906 start_codon:yes stop_codon:yes gene_type:complete